MAFVAAVSVRGFTEAGDRIGIGRSAVSRGVQKL